MQSKAKPSEGVSTAAAQPPTPALAGRSSTKDSHAGQFMAVFDSRNRRVPGLSIRNGRYYGQLWADRGDGVKRPRRYPLALDGAPVSNVTQAKEAMEILRHARREDALPAAGHKPTFARLADDYLASAKFMKKKPGTRENEVQALKRWKAHLGQTRVDKITPAMLHSYAERRLRGERIGETRAGTASERTVNLDAIAARHVFKYAETLGHIRQVPAMEKLAETPAEEHRLLAPAELIRLTDAARTACQRNGEQVADYLRFLAFTGCREQEALRIKWADIDLVAETLRIGADGDTKNRRGRDFHFNPQLGALLRDMHARRAPDSEWLFPSPRRGEADRPARSFRESLNLARAAAGLEWVGFHSLRHYFASVCVMAGIDFMTIAKWLGHRDGGILIGKTYGHLSDEHKRRMAGRLNLTEGAA